MVLFLLYCDVSQKTVASISNYTDRQVRNIRDHFENSDGDFPKGAGKKCRKPSVLLFYELTRPLREFLAKILFALFCF